MYVKIVGGNLDNCGDHLMLIAAIAALRCFTPQPHIVTSILSRDSYRQRAELGLYQTLPIPRRLCLFRVAGVPILRRYGSSFGIIPDEEVELFLDMSGYAYADRWGSHVIKDRVVYYKELSKRGKKIVFLPQAFGPFERSSSQALLRELIGLADMVFARDRVSYEQVAQVSERSETIRLAPEFTQVLQPHHTESLRDCVAVIPNIQVIRQNHSVSQAAYLAFLDRVISGIKQIGLTPVVVQFSQHADAELVRDIRNRHHDVGVIRSGDPLRLKSAIAACRAAVCSRYHSFVSALSTGVPAATTAWSHKYVEFAREYDMEDCVLDVTADVDRVLHVLQTICIDEHQRLTEKLLARSLGQREAIQEMWSTIAEVAKCNFSRDSDSCALPTGSVTE